MPMFQDPSDMDRRRPTSPNAPARPPSPARPIAIQLSARRMSEESIRTELCEGPLPDSPPNRVDSDLGPDSDAEAIATSNRAELIERLKRGESPTWIPNRHLESLFHPRGPPSPTRGRLQPETAATLLPAAAITSESASRLSEEERLQDGLGIERPRSALHSGDFTQDSGPARAHPSRGASEEVQQDLRDRNRDVDYSSRSWLASSPPGRSSAIDIGVGSRMHFSRQTGPHAPPLGMAITHKSGLSSLSSSFSSNFAYMHPTSPLVQSESNEDIDFTVPLGNIDIGSNMARSSRRHTLTSHEYGSPTPRSRTASAHAPSHEPSPNLRREGTFPYQAHQPRRSLTSFPSLSMGHVEPSPAFLRSRRPSFGSDSSPLQHASMVGSYEESILRGRMSTTPSRPLDFLAQIGVLGIGKCKPSLRCPPHVTLPFSAVFYSYASTSHGRCKSEDGPSPYVGMIDLENGLANQGGEASRARRKMQSRSLARRAREDRGEDASMGGDSPSETAAAAPSDAESRGPTKSKRRSTSPKAPPGGSYRIPGKGQLQIIIKNQNKTAVKLFLVPYDLTGMEAGTKTFIRQRIFSTGHPIDGLVSTGPADGSSDSAAAAAAAAAADAAARPILRYLIHLHICCPSKGRYFLYKSVRVVFANRVPDGKEKLRSEVTFPEPRFSIYKPIRVMHPPLAPQSAGPGALLAADKAFRRRSSGFMLDSSGLGSSPGVLDVLDGVSRSLQASNSRSVGDDMHGHGLYGRFAAATPPKRIAPGFFAASEASGREFSNAPVDPIPLRLPRGRIESITSDGSDATTGAQTATSSQTSRPATRVGDSRTEPSASLAATVAWPAGDGNGGRVLGDGFDPGRVSPSQYNKLTRGDVGYGGNAFVMPAHGPNGLPGAAEGLLSQRLRSLGVQGDMHNRDGTPGDAA